MTRFTVHGVDVTTIAVSLATAVLCGAAARRVAVAKGFAEGNYAALGFFTGPIGLAVTAFKRPMWAGPEEERPDRLAWWTNDARTRPWVVLASVLFVASLVITAVAAAQPTKVSGSTLDGQIKAWLAKQGAPGAAVSCPSYELKANYRFLCTASDDTGQVTVEVTVLNGNGDAQWQVVG